MYIELSKKSQKFLEKLEVHIANRIEQKLKSLSMNPIPKNAIFIYRTDSGDMVFRYRIGDFRVLYKVKPKEKIVLIAKIDKRSRVYKDPRLI